MITKHRPNRRLSAVVATWGNFDRSFLLLITGAVVIIMVLILMVFVKGPRIREVTFNPELLTQTSGQWLVLHTNQPLRPVSVKQVSVVPYTPINVLSSGNEVAIQFEQRLPYETTYTIKLTATPVKLTYRFTTSVAASYYLESPGTIKEHIVGQDVDRTVFQAGFINDFALSGKYLAVVVQNGSTDQLRIVNTQTGKSYAANLPEAGMISKVHASPDGEDFTFTLTSEDISEKPYYNTTLFTFNAVTNKSSLVYGFNRSPIRVTDWTYAPGGSVIVAQTFSSVIEAVYLNGQASPLPLGAYGIIAGFSSDGSKIYVGTVQRGMEYITIATRKVTLLNQTPLGAGSSLQLVLPLQNSGGYVMQVQKPLPNSANLAQYIILVEGGHERILYASSNGTDAIAGISLSPNDQYVSIGLSPTYFTRSNDGTPAGTLTVDVANGKVIDHIPSLEQVLWQ